MLSVHLPFPRTRWLEDRWQRDSARSVADGECARRRCTKASASNCTFDSQYSAARILDAGPGLEGFRVINESIGLPRVAVAVAVAVAG